MEKNLFWISPIVVGVVLLGASFINAATNFETSWDFFRHLGIWIVADIGGIFLYRGLVLRKTAKK